jgi:hypothetical protein
VATSIGALARSDFVLSPQSVSRSRLVPPFGREQTDGSKLTSEQSTQFISVLRIEIQRGVTLFQQSSDYEGKMTPNVCAATGLGPLGLRTLDLCDLAGMVLRGMGEFGCSCNFSSALSSRRVTSAEVFHIVFLESRSRFFSDFSEFRTASSC